VTGVATVDSLERRALGAAGRAVAGGLLASRLVESGAGTALITISVVVVARVPDGGQPARLFADRGAQPP
jgi:hypothetical protein